MLLAENGPNDIFISLEAAETQIHPVTLFGWCVCSRICYILLANWGHFCLSSTSEDSLRVNIGFKFTFR